MKTVYFINAGVHLPLIHLPGWLIYLLLGFVVFHLFVECILEIVSALYGHIPGTCNLLIVAIFILPQVDIKVTFLLFLLWIVNSLPVQFTEPVPAPIKQKNMYLTC